MYLRRLPDGTEISNTETAKANPAIENIPPLPTAEEIRDLVKKSHETL